MADKWLLILFFAFPKKLLDNTKVNSDPCMSLLVSRVTCKCRTYFLSFRFNSNGLFGPFVVGLEFSDFITCPSVSFWCSPWLDGDWIWYGKFKAPPLSVTRYGNLMTVKENHFQTVWLISMNDITSGYLAVQVVELNNLNLCWQVSG